MRLRVAVGIEAVVIGLALVGGLAAAGAGASAASRTAPKCGFRTLTVTVAVASPGASHHGYVLRFRDRGAACSLQGYPMVTGLSSGGRRLFTARRTRRGYLGGVKGAVLTVTLRAGETASALFEYIDGPVPGLFCAHATALQVTAPLTSNAVRVVPAGLGSDRVCDPEVHPVVSGLWGGQ